MGQPGDTVKVKMQVLLAENLMNLMAEKCGKVQSSNNILHLIN